MPFTRRRARGVRAWQCDIRYSEVRREMAEAAPLQSSVRRISMKTHSRRMVAAAVLAALALGSTATLAGEGGGGHHSAQRAKLKAEWAEARARNAADADASFVERLFGSGEKETKVATAPAAAQPKKN
jgi:hypothetical protein